MVNLDDVIFLIIDSLIVAEKTDLKKPKVHCITSILIYLYNHKSNTKEGI
jgi:hypothetical protein